MCLRDTLKSCNSFLIKDNTYMVLARRIMLAKIDTELSSLFLPRDVAFSDFYILFFYFFSVISISLFSISFYQPTITTTRPRFAEPSAPDHGRILIQVWIPSRQKLQKGALHACLSLVSGLPRNDDTKRVPLLALNNRRESSKPLSCVPVWNSSVPAVCRWSNYADRSQR